MRDWGGRNSVAAYKYFWHRAMQWWWWWWLLGGGRKWSLLTCFLDINYQHCLHHVQSVFITLSLSRFVCIPCSDCQHNIMIQPLHQPPQVSLSWQTIKVSALNSFSPVLQINFLYRYLQYVSQGREFIRAFVRFLIELLHQAPWGTILKIQTSGERLHHLVHNVFNAMSATHLQDSDSDLASLVSAGHVNIIILLGLHQWCRLWLLQHRHGEKGGH